LDERGWRWLKARKPKIVEGKSKFDRPETEAVAEKILQLAELQKKGQFKPHREKDMLSTAIGSKEHGGCCRCFTDCPLRGIPKVVSLGEETPRLGTRRCKEQKT
jgi:hypothetical protein